MLLVTTPLLMLSIYTKNDVMQIALRVLALSRLNQLALSVTMGVIFAAMRRKMFA